MLSDAVLSDEKENLISLENKTLLFEYDRRRSHSRGCEMGSNNIDTTNSTNHTPNDENRMQNKNSDLISKKLEDNNLVGKVNQTNRDDTIALEDGNATKLINCDNALIESKKQLTLDLNVTTKPASPPPSIPTAIVKPKYQRSSYDDRQLPPVGCINERCLSYHQSYNNDYTSQKPKYIQQLPHFDRKSTNTRIIIPLTSSSVTTTTATKSQNHDRKIQFMSGNEKELINAKLNQLEKDIDCKNSVNNKSLLVRGSVASNTIAIVQPRKRDKIELNLMEKRNKNYHPHHQQQQQNNRMASIDDGSTISADNNNVNTDKNINNNSMKKMSMTCGKSLIKDNESKVTCDAVNSTLVSRTSTGEGSDLKSGNNFKESISGESFYFF